jgi:hypothetical protein
VAILNKYAMVVIYCLLAACGTSEQPAPNRYVALESNEGQLYRQQIQPILDKRCIVCHGCYDAPCQLNLASAQGIDRGANPQAIYNGKRLTADPLTRLFEDAQTVDEWRKKGFFSVLAEKRNEHPLHGSLMHKMLSLKQRNPLENTVSHNEIIPDGLFEFALNAKDTCPDIKQFENYAGSKPYWGMPYGLPGIEATAFKRLENWLEAGAPIAKLPELNKNYQDLINIWEAFLNGDSIKQRLVSRYIYEHLFLGHLYFPDLEDDTPTKTYFKIVRSRTGPGQPINIVSTRRPYDDPQVERVYYRLQQVQYSITAKNHLPYALNKERLQRFKTLFFDFPYEVKELPDYLPELTANPFKTFSAIPARIRYRFMLEHAHFTLDGFIKGAVCRGQVALNVINDHFWVFFVDPDHEALGQIDHFLSAQSDQLRLPSERESNAGVLNHWTEYSALQASYLKEKSAVLNKIFQDSADLNLDWVWRGDGHNSNAALTIFRHFDSATVVEGLIGQQPKTAWLIDYPILERIHYLLVAGFDVYGNVGHQLSTRLYMDFLRMEGEFNFLALLPEETRTMLREYWYRDASETVKNYVYGHASLYAEPDIAYPPEESAQEFLFKQLQSKLSSILSHRYHLEHPSVPEFHRQLLNPLHEIRGQSATLLPEMGLLMVLDKDYGDRVYTLIRNSAHSHIASLLNEQTNRIPEEDSITVIPGFVGAYPGAFWQVKAAALRDFSTRLNNLKNENDYRELMHSYGIRRSHNEFWQFSDYLHEIFQRTTPIAYGMLDYNRLENR